MRGIPWRSRDSDEAEGTRGQGPARMASFTMSKNTASSLEPVTVHLKLMAGEARKKD